jgi:hypothetical protein
MTPLGLLALEPADPEPRQCASCLRWYRIGNPRVACAAMHPPGSCCHYGDTEVPAPETPDRDAPVDSEPTGEALRARYAGQTKMVDEAMVARLLGCDEIDPFWAVAFRYETAEAFEAFADGNRRHYGHKTFGPVPSGDGGFYGLTILKQPQ